MSKRQEYFAYMSNENSRVIHFSRHFSQYAAEKHYGNMDRYYKGGAGSDYYVSVLTREDFEKLESSYVIDWKKRTLTPKAEGQTK